MITPQDGASQAEQAISDVVSSVRIVGVKRHRRAGELSGWRREAQLVSDLPLEMYVGYRLSVGGTREEASAEWHAARTVGSDSGLG